MSNASTEGPSSEPSGVSWIHNELALTFLELFVIVAIALTIGVIAGAAAFGAGYVAAASATSELRGRL